MAEKESTIPQGPPEKKQKATMGRQKIPIKKIEDKKHLQVTFTKRRKGLFRKASELSLLHGPHVAVIVFSPSEKVFSCGLPDIDSVVSRYIGEESWQLQDSSVSGSSMLHTHQLQREEYKELRNRLQVEKRRAAEAMEEQVKRRQNGGNFWWEEEKVEEMGLEELEYFVKAMVMLRKNVNDKVNMQ